MIKDYLSDILSTYFNVNYQFQRFISSLANLNMLSFPLGCPLSFIFFHLCLFDMSLFTIVSLCYCFTQPQRKAHIHTYIHSFSSSSVHSLDVVEVETCDAEEKKNLRDRIMRQEENKKEPNIRR